MVNNIKN